MGLGKLIISRHCVGYVALLCLCLLPVVPGLAQSRRPPSPQANPVLQKAAQFLESGKPGDAEILLKEYLGKAPKDLKARGMLGVALDQQNRSQEAESVYREVLSGSPSEISVLTNLGVLLVRTNRQDEALKVFERVLLLQPTHRQASYNLAALYSAKNENKKALRLLEGLAGITVKKRPPTTKDPELLFALTKAYAASGQPRE